MIEKHNLLTGSVPRKLAVFALPLLLANILQSFYNVVDMLVIGQIVGDVGLAAINNASKLCYIINSKRGMNPAILKQILGHDDISTTFAIYTHLKDDDCMDELERLGLADTSTNKAKKVSALDNSKIIDFQSWSA